SLVRLLQRFSDLDSDAKQLLERQRTPGDAIGQRLAFQKLHDEVVLADVVERADMRVIELGDRARFPFETRLELHVLRELGRKNLDGHTAIEPRVASSPNLAHPARPERRNDFVWPQARARSERHESVREILLAVPDASPKRAHIPGVKPAVPCSRRGI